MTPMTAPAYLAIISVTSLFVEVARFAKNLKIMTILATLAQRTHMING